MSSIAFKQCYNCGSKFLSTRRVSDGYDLSGEVIKEGYAYICKCYKCGAHSEGKSWAELEDNWVLKRFLYLLIPEKFRKTDGELKEFVNKSYPTIGDYLEQRKKELSPCDDAECADAPPHQAGGVFYAPPLLGGVKSQFKDSRFELRTNEKNCLGVDWLQGTFSYEKKEIIKKYIEKMTQNKPEQKSGLIGFEKSLVWEPYGIKILFDVTDEFKSLHGARCVLQIGGTGLKCFPPKSLYIFFGFLREMEFSATRIDLCFDDFLRIIKPSEVYEIADNNPDFVSGFRTVDSFKGRVLGKKGVSTNDGVAFGRRGKDGGGKYLRCYDKQLESKGEINSIRWEIEFTKDKAKRVFNELSNCKHLKIMAEKIGEFIGGSIDFVPRRGKRRYDSDRLEFWQKIIDILGKARVRVESDPGSIQKTEKWMMKAVVPSLLKLGEAQGSVFLDNLQTALKNCKLSNRAKGQIAIYQDYLSDPDFQKVNWLIFFTRKHNGKF